MMVLCFPRLLLSSVVLSLFPASGLPATPPPGRNRTALLPKDDVIAQFPGAEVRLRFSFTENLNLWKAIFPTFFPHMCYVYFF